MFLSEGPSQLTKASLMLAIEELQPSDVYVQEQTNSEKQLTQEEEKAPVIPLFEEEAKV